MKSTRNGACKAAGTYCFRKLGRSWAIERPLDKGLQPPPLVSQLIQKTKLFSNPSHELLDMIAKHVHVGLEILYFVRRPDGLEPVSCADKA